MKHLFLALVTLGMAVASAAPSYKITLFQPSIVAGKELRPGDYKIELKEGSAVLSKGKESVEAQVKTEASATKFAGTSVRYMNGDGKYRIAEIRLGGTTTKILFSN
jgi:hypothetical protein